VHFSHPLLFSPADLPQEVMVKRAQMDKGIRIGSWGQLQG
jgi:hypothetical protein